MNHNSRVLFASFLTLVAAGIGFAIRAKALGDWGANFGFTKSELGTITGGGLVGFGVTIISCSLFIDRVGYRPLMVIAFLLHILSAFITTSATLAFEYFENGKDAAYCCLYMGTFMFALANGICEAVINPLVATMYPYQRTHYLNILHTGWPGGLVIGGVWAFLFVGPEASVRHLAWEFSIALFLFPVFIYGLLILKQTFPISEARAAGITFRTMLMEFKAPVLLLLLLLHAMIGYVELGTDNWITDIMNNVIRGKATLLFVYTSILMFVLRFFAGPIVKRINPVGLLFICSVFGAVGLYWLGSTTAGWAVFLAATIYGIGKTFFWPTMLGIVGEQFPKGGALTMGAIGGIGALSAGLLGGPGIGYKQDYYAAQKLKHEAPTVYELYRSQDTTSFLMLPEISGLDGSKVGTLNNRRTNMEKKTDAGEAIRDDERLTAKEKHVLDAGFYGGQMALKWTAVVPLMMAVGYLVLILYFRAQGGYRVEVLINEKRGTY